MSLWKEYILAVEILNFLISNAASLWRVGFEVKLVWLRDTSRVIETRIRVNVLWEGADD